jgi:hypothetical protein
MKANVDCLIIHVEPQMLSLIHPAMGALLPLETKSRVMHEVSSIRQPQLYVSSLPPGSSKARHDTGDF